MTVTTAVVVLPRRVAVWANRRALARNSLTGIELACALCAAVWFSAGTPLSALAGGAALGGGYLARRVGGQLTVGAFDGWLAGACALAGELAVYAGLAAGAAPGRAGSGPWPLRLRYCSGCGRWPGCAVRTALRVSHRRRWTSRRWRPTARSAPWPSWPAACWGCPRGSGRR